ncbi:MAG: hypothetical protein M3Y77_12350, partial [Actinomycetota bacterium]|nr:hypothetical protein [Actinomycetota bacterium]
MHIVTDVVIAGVVVAIAAGGFVAGGVLAALVAAGIAIVTIVSPDAWKKIWGVVSCGSEPDKCLAQMAAKGMAFSSGLVADAATHTAYPQMTGPTSKVFNQIAGLSGVLVMILFLLALAWAVFTGRVGQIIPSTLGLLRWGIAMGAGASLLTLAFTASDLVAQAIAGSDAGGPASSLGSLGQTATRIAIGIGSRAGFLQWIVVALVCVIGMICALVVWVVVFLTSQFIPFVLAVMLLQYAGSAGSDKARTWSSIGWGLLWTILLLRPIIALIAKLAQVRALEEGMQGLLTVTATLAVAALAPGMVSKWFPTAASASMGIMQRLGGAVQDIDAGSRVARRMGAAAAGGASRAGSLGRMLGGGDSVGGFGPGSGPGGGGLGAVRKAPTGPPTPLGAATATGGSARNSDTAAGGRRAAGSATSIGVAGAGDRTVGAAIGGADKTGNAASTRSGESWAAPVDIPVAAPPAPDGAAPEAVAASGPCESSAAAPTPDGSGAGQLSGAARSSDLDGRGDSGQSAVGHPAGSVPGAPADQAGTSPVGSDSAGITRPPGSGIGAGRHGSSAAGASGGAQRTDVEAGAAPRHATTAPSPAVESGFIGGLLRPSAAPMVATEQARSSSAQAGPGSLPAAPDTSGGAPGPAPAAGSRPVSVLAEPPAASP